MRVICLVSLAISLGAACGGKTTLETSAAASGAGGASSSSGTGSSTHASGTTTTTTTSTSTSVSSSAASSSGAVDCSTLITDLSVALQAASACNACKNSDDCIGAPVLFDVCGCPYAMNQTLPPQVLQAAKDAEAAYQASGCMVACEVACGMGGTFHCGPDMGGGCNGHCTQN